MPRTRPEHATYKVVYSFGQNSYGHPDTSKHSRFGITVRDNLEVSAIGVAISLGRLADCYLGLAGKLNHVLPL